MANKGVFGQISRQSWPARGLSDDYRRDKLLRIIEHSVEKLTLSELEALYYDMTTKSYIGE